MGTIDLGLTALAAAEGDKHEAPELLVLIVLPLVLSFILLRFAQRRQGGATWQKWASLVPLVAGALMAIDPFGDVRTPSYIDFHDVTDRSSYLHYASLLVPCVAILAVVAYLLYDAHRERMEQ